MVRQTLRKNTRICAKRTFNTSENNGLRLACGSSHSTPVISCYVMHALPLAANIFFTRKG